MLIFIVSSKWEGDGEVIERIFDTLEKAKGYIASLNDNVCRDITEYEVE